MRFLNPSGGDSNSHHPLITLRGSTLPAPPEWNLVLDHKWRRFHWLHQLEVLAVSGRAELFFAKLLILTGGDFALRKSVHTKGKPSACNSISLQKILLCILL